MAKTVNYRNAVLLAAGADLSGDVTDLAIDYSAEILDATTMGNTTRIHKGGLFVGKMSGTLLYESGQGLVETVLFPLVDVNQTVLTVFPDGVIEGALGIGSGYMCRGVLSQFNIGGKVGTLLPISFAFEGEGYGN